MSQISLKNDVSHRSYNHSTEDVPIENINSSDITIERRKVTHKRQGKFRVFHNFALVSQALKADLERRRKDKNAIVSSY